MQVAALRSAVGDPLSDGQAAQRRPGRMPIGTVLDGICVSCHRHTYLKKVSANGWRCPDCDHVHEGRFRAAMRSARTVDHHEVIRQHLAGVPVLDIARGMGVSRFGAEYAIRQAGMTPLLRRRKPRATKGGTPDSVVIPDEMIAAYPATTAREIAAACGCSLPTVYRRLRAAGKTIAYQRVVMARRPQVVARSREALARAERITLLRDSGKKWLEVAMSEGCSEANAGRLYRAYLRGELLCQRIDAEVAS